MKVSLVIMAAGMGSRYGGSKQVDGIGPHHEILMEYSIYDALRAGFNKIVFIIKPEMEQMMRELCGDYLTKKTARDGNPVEVAYAFQDFSSVPSFYHIPEERTKPFGTVHGGHTGPVHCGHDPRRPGDSGVCQRQFCILIEERENVMINNSYRPLYFHAVQC